MYFRKVIELSEKVDLVFFDPDNGITPNKKCKKDKKYIYWDEIQNTWQQGKDILIYQQFRHIERKKFIKDMKEECENELNGSNVILFTSSDLMFILLSHENNKQQVMEIENQWEKLISLEREKSLPIRTDNGKKFNYTIDSNPNMLGI